MLYNIHDLKIDPTSGITIENNLDVTGSTDLGGYLNVKGNTYLKNSEIFGDLRVTGTSQLETLNVSGNLDVVGNISLNGSNIINSDGSMEVTGTAQLNALNVTGNTDINGTLSTTGTLNINPFKQLLFSDFYGSFSSLKVKLDKTQYIHSGEVGLYDTNNSGLLTLTYYDDVGYIYNHGHASIGFSPGDITFQQAVNFAGNVGIGVASPQVKLDITGSNNGQSLQLRSGDDSFSTDSCQIIFAYDGSSYNNNGLAHSIRTRHNQFQAFNNAIDFYCWTNADNPSTLGSKRIMTIDGYGTGSVGIGNPFPTAPLSFENNLINKKLTLYDNSVNDHQFYGFGVNANILRYQLDTTLSSHVFYAGTSPTTSNELFRVQGNGNVGIGNTNPTAPLSFANVSVVKKITLYDENGDNNQFFGFGAASGVLRYQVAETTHNHIFYAGTSSTTSNELFRVQGDGTVVVPNGSFITTGNIISTGNISSSGNITANSGSIITNKIGVRTTPNSTVDIAIGDNDSGFKQQGDGRIAFVINGNERGRYDYNGHFGLGTDNPLCVLHTKAKNTDDGGSLASYNQANIIIEGSGNTNKWALSINNGGGQALIFSYNLAERGYMISTGNVGQIDFTGQHRARFSEDNINKLNNINDYVGLIVCSTGNYINPIDINEALPYVELSTTSKDIRVFGVISNGEDTNSNKREYQQGTFVSVIDIEENDHRAIINSVGEGAMWICDENGPIKNGNYITTSNNTGYGMKQDDDLIHSYTVAKITQNEDFSDMTNGRILPNGVKCKFVGVTYHCG